MYGDCVLSRERSAQRHLSFDDVAKTNLLSQDSNSMVQLREKQNFSGFKHHAKVHSFRIITAILTWVLLGATLFYKPEWIRSALRTGTRAIEGVGDALPSYWGAQAEIVLRELGGFLWIQITAAIIFVRFVLWLIAAAWRRGGNRA